MSSTAACLSVDGTIVSQLLQQTVDATCTILPTFIGNSVTNWRALHPFISYKPLIRTSFSLLNIIIYKHRISAQHCVVSAATVKKQIKYVKAKGRGKLNGHIIFSESVLMTFAKNHQNQSAFIEATACENLRVFWDTFLECQRWHSTFRCHGNVTAKELLTDLSLCRWSVLVATLHKLENSAIARRIYATGNSLNSTSGQIR